MGTSRASIRSSLLLLAGPLLAGCSSVAAVSEQDPLASLADFEAYAWAPLLLEAPADAAAGGAGDDEAELERRIRTAVDRELVSGGLRLAADAEGGLLVRPTLAIEVQQQSHDPYFAGYTVELVERGRLTLEFLDATSGESVWRASATAKLRTAARGYGLYEARVEPTKETRSWPIESMVRAIKASYRPRAHP